MNLFLVFSFFLVSSVITTETLLSIEGAIAAIIQQHVKCSVMPGLLFCVKIPRVGGVFLLDGGTFFAQSVCVLFMSVAVARIAIVKLR